MDDQPIPTWRVGDQAQLAGERVTIRGFMDSGAGPLDEIVVELANGDERTVHREQLVPLPTFHGSGATREVRLASASARLDPAESLTMARHSPNGFNWGYGGSGPAQLALAILLQVTHHETPLAHYQAFKWDGIARLPDGDFELPVAAVHDWLASRRRDAITRQP